MISKDYLLFRRKYVISSLWTSSQSLWAAIIVLMRVRQAIETCLFQLQQQSCSSNGHYRLSEWIIRLLYHRNPQWDPSPFFRPCFWPVHAWRFHYCWYGTLARIKKTIMGPGFTCGTGKFMPKGPYNSDKFWSHRHQQWTSFKQISSGNRKARSSIAIVPV